MIIVKVSHHGIYSLTIGAGPRTGRKTIFRLDILVGNFGVPLKRSSRANQLALLFTVQPKIPDFL